MLCLSALVWYCSKDAHILFSFLIIPFAFGPHSCKESMVCVFSSEFKAKESLLKPASGSLISCVDGFAAAPFAVIPSCWQAAQLDEFYRIFQLFQLLCRLPSGTPTDWRECRCTLAPYLKLDWWVHCKSRRAAGESLSAKKGLKILGLRWASWNGENMWWLRFQCQCVWLCIPKSARCRQYSCCG